MAMLDNVETKPVSRIHSASLEKDDVDTLVPMINDYEPFCDTLAVSPSPLRVSPCRRSA